MDGPLYAIRGLAQEYRGKTVLRIDRLDLPRGGIVGVMGPNGSGKSTFLRLLGFVERPAAGEIAFNGRPAGPFAAEVRGRVALLPQEPFLLKRSVLENVVYGLRIRGVNGPLEERAAQALSFVGLDARRFARRPSEALSGGEAQRVALAARLALQPEVLLLDEPTASVDALSAQLIQEAALKAQRDWGTTLVVASHDAQWLYEVSDKVLHLLKGRVFGTGRENVLFGPWQRAPGGDRWEKPLADGQRLVVPPPPEADAAAVIDELRLLGDDGPQAMPWPTGHTLSGVITRLALEKTSGNVRTCVLVSGIPFTLVLSPRQVEEQGLFPGRRAVLGYDADAIRWF